MQLLTSVVTSKFSCPTFRVFPGKRHESSTSQPAPLLASSSWELIPPFCGEKNLLLTFLADFPSYSPFFKKKTSPFLPTFLVASKVLQNSNLIHPFFTQGTPTDSSKISVSATSPQLEEAASRFSTRVVHRKRRLCIRNGIFLGGYARYLENSSMNEWTKRKPGTRVQPPKAEGQTGPFSVYMFLVLGSGPHPRF